MDAQTAAIILCAGVGSRLGLSPMENKCAVDISGTCPVRHSAAALLRAGVDSIVVVLGHASVSVKKALADYERRGAVHFVSNPYYSRHGCNYSLSCAMSSPYLERAGRVIIAEGDSLLCEDSIQQLSGTDAPAASLLRDMSYIDYSKSVVAIGCSGKILRYGYDSTHAGIRPTLEESERIMGESMQLWTFSGAPLQKLRELFRAYKEKADSSEEAFLHSGVHSINMLEAEIEPVYSNWPEEWINLNTINDLRKAEMLPWLIK